jgi:hypothetical protein
LFSKPAKNSCFATSLAVTHASERRPLRNLLPFFAKTKESVFFETSSAASAVKSSDNHEGVRSIDDKVLDETLHFLLDCGTEEQ